MINTFWAVSHLGMFLVLCMEYGHHRSMWKQPTHKNYSQEGKTRAASVAVWMGPCMSPEAAVTLKSVETAPLPPQDGT